MSFRPLVIAVLLFIPGMVWGQSASPQKECLLSSLGTCAVHVVQDEIGIVSSPLRTSGKDLLWLVPFAAATGVSLHYDVDAIQELGVHPDREDKFEKVSNIGGIYGPVAAAGVGYVVGAVKHDDYLRDTAVLSAEAMVDATLLDQGLKYAIDRQDPKQGDGTGKFWPHGTKTWPDGQSMPSEHAINVWAFAHVVAGRYNGIGTKLLVYSLATTVSASRVLAREHFPSDVVVGSTFGYLIGGYVLHHRSDVAPLFSFNAVSTPNGKGIQVSYNFSH
jgi:hypothetical protein